MACLFCTNKDIQARIVKKTKHSFAFPTNIPITPGHLLVCPIRCVAKLEELTAEELLNFFQLVSQLKVALQKTFAVEGFNCAWNEGAVAGQKINHLHLHIVPRKKGDAGIMEYDPRAYLYRPGPREETNEQKLQEMAAKIKANLSL